MLDNVGQFLDKVKWAMRATARRRWLALSAAFGVAVLSAAVIVMVPDRFEASSRVYVDTQTVLKPLMVGLTFQPDIDEQVSMLARTLISRPNMERLIRTNDIQPDAQGAEAQEALVSRLMEKVKLAPTKAGNLYEISYRGSSPEQSKRLVEAVVSLFVHTGAGAKQRDSQEAGRFIDDQIRDYEAKLEEAENRRKEFKVRTFGVSGIASQDYFTRVSALSDEMNKLQIELGAAERARDSYRGELAKEDPQLPAKRGATSEGDAETDLQARRKTLDELLLLYTEEHPEVRNTRRVIRQLDAELHERKEEQRRAWIASGRPGEPTPAPTSPVYQKLRISLADSEAQLASLRSQVANQQVRLDQARALAGQAPQVEAELAQLNRDYEIIRQKYDAMVARREAASLGVKLDQSSQLAEFHVIDPPRVSRLPVFPGRWQLSLIAIVLSLCAGVAVVMAAEVLRPTVDEAASLQQISGRPVAGTVTRLLTADERRQRRNNSLMFMAASAGLIALQGVWVAWLLLQLHPEWSL